MKPKSITDSSASFVNQAYVAVDGLTTLRLGVRRVEDLNPKMGKMLDFLKKKLNFFQFFQDFWIFGILFGFFS